MTLRSLEFILKFYLTIPDYLVIVKLELLTSY